MSDDIATVRLRRGDDGTYSVWIDHADGSSHSSDAFVTVDGALTRAAQVIANKERRRKAADDPRGSVP